MLSHLLAASLTNARRKLYSWFHQPIDTMSDFNPWETITDRSLSQQIQLVLHLFNTAASASPSPVVVLDRLQVVSIWLNKSSGSLEHEFMVIKTKDSEDKKMRLFIIDRITRRPHRQPASENPVCAPEPPDQPKGDNSYQRLQSILQKACQELSNSILSPSRSISPLSSMEEGFSSTSTSTPAHIRILPPVTLPTSQLSIGDTLSLSAAKASQTVSDSLDKGGKVEAFDRVLGEEYIERPMYGCGQNARQIKPMNLSFFELIVLAKVVHDFAQNYSIFERNCFWFSNMMMDAIIAIFGHEDNDRENNFVPIDIHHSDISRRWKGMKVTHTKPEELQTVIHDFKVRINTELSTVNFFFLRNYYSLLKFEQIYKSIEDKYIGTAYRQHLEENSELRNRHDKLIRRKQKYRLVDE
jgi:hypothetical protein